MKHCSVLTLSIILNLVDQNNFQYNISVLDIYINKYISLNDYFEFHGSIENLNFHKFS